MSTVTIDTSGRDMIVAGKVYRPDLEGKVTLPKAEAIAEGHWPEDEDLLVVTDPDDAPALRNVITPVSPWE